jgi:hypothetical protein
MENQDGEAIEINTDLYEYLSIWSMECGQDNVNEFINDLLMWGMKQKEIRQMIGLGQEQEEE